MKTNKGDKRSQQVKGQNGDTLQHVKMTRKKVKYNHKSHWLTQDDDYALPSYRDEEE